MADWLLTEVVRPGVVVVTLDRPDKRNALSNALMSELIERMGELAADPSNRVAVLRGAGKVFCAGLDLAEAANAENAETSARLVNDTLRTLHESRLVTIAAVHGAAIAGGAGVMSACDLVVAEAGAKIGYPEVRRGLIAALVSELLISQVGPRAARELLLVADLIDAERAHSLGLVNRVVPVGGAYDAAVELASQVMLGGPDAVRQTKQLVNRRVASAIGDTFNELIDHHLAARNSPESQEGMRAFLEKRQPNWVEPKSRSDAE